MTGDVPRLAEQPLVPLLLTRDEAEALLAYWSATYGKSVDAFLNPVLAETLVRSVDAIAKLDKAVRKIRE